MTRPRELRRNQGPLTKEHTAGSTKGVRILRGDPRRAMIKLALPMIVALSVATVYNLADALWVAGLGADALSAVGLFFPFFFMMMALGTGVGLGGGSAISRRIGARDKEGADTVAAHTIVLMLIISAALVVPFLIFLRPIFRQLGAGRTLPLSVAYARIMFVGAPVIIFSHVANALLRGEGDVKRAMAAMMVGSGLNIVLDPVFIYWLGWGVAGAAWATVISLGVTASLLLVWLFWQQSTYVTFAFRCFRLQRDIIRDILRVGLPASVSQLSMSLSILFLNLILVRVGGTDAVAVYTTGWRVAMIAVVPLMGVATALVSVSGAAFGAGEYDKVKVALWYALKLGVLVELGVAAGTFLMAEPIAAIFTRAEGAERIATDLITLLRIICLFYPTAAFGVFSSAVFQGTGKGMNALIATVIRTIVFTPFCALLLSLVMGLDLVGVWLGMVAGNAGGALLVFLWVRRYLAALLQRSDYLPADRYVARSALKGETT